MHHISYHQLCSRDIRTDDDFYEKEGRVDDQQRQNPRLTFHCEWPRLKDDKEDLSE